MVYKLRFGQQRRGVGEYDHLIIVVLYKKLTTLYAFPL